MPNGKSELAGDKIKSTFSEHVTSILKPGEIVYDPSASCPDYDSDEEALVALGYKP